MTITAKIITDSINPAGVRLTTFVCRYPRFIHSEIMTHRALSRNASSSRAIPVKTMIKQVLDDPAVPVFWGKNKAGMQAKEELTGWRLHLVKAMWLLSRYPAVLFALIMIKLQLHKQIANRILEPWMYIETIITATEWTNFFSLRLHPDAQPEFQQLAKVMAKEYLKSKPLMRDHHLPFVTKDEMEKYSIGDCLRFSVARCARVSYLNHDGSKPNIKKDLELWTSLKSAGHMSPFEHQAWWQHDSNKFSGNIRGYIQYRKSLGSENLDKFPWETNPQLLTELTNG